METTARTANLSAQIQAKFLLNPNHIYCHKVHTVIWIKVSNMRGRAIAQAVSRWLPTAAARVQNWVWSCHLFLLFMHDSLP
jgi:hypothetical protein